MDTHPDTQSEPRLIPFPVKSLRSKRTDPLGYWFSAVVMVAFLAAGIITWRTGFSDTRTRSWQVAAAPAHSDANDFPPIYAHIEGVDP